MAAVRRGTPSSRRLNGTSRSSRACAVIHARRSSRQEVRMSNRIECGLFFPQVGVDVAALVERALACEETGWHSVWLADHMWARGLPDVDHLEIWTALTALAMRTTKLR